MVIKQSERNVRVDIVKQLDVRLLDDRKGNQKVMSIQIRKRNQSFSSIIPVKDYDDTTDCFIYKDNSYMDLLKITSKDLMSKDVSTVQLDCMRFVKLYRTYGDDLKIIGMNFPIDTSEQINYFNTIKKRTNNILYQGMLDEKLQELETIQHNMTEREYYIMFFGKKREDIIDNRNSIKGIMERNSLISFLSKEKKLQILYKINNPCTRIPLQSNATKEQASEEVIKKLGYNPNIIEAVQTRGGINFSSDDRVIKTGDGYMSCLYIHEYPEDLKMHWLAPVVNINHVISVIDMETQTNLAEVKKNINRSIAEHKGRYDNSKEATERRDAETRYKELNVVYEELASMGEIIKNIRIRLFISSDTYIGLEERVSNVKNELDTAGFKCAIGLNEGEWEWKSIYSPYRIQNMYINARQGQPVFSETMAGGNPFHFASLTDANGSPYGVTDSTGGAVLWDNFCKTKVRLSYNVIVFGGMGSGKSTFMKINFKDRAMRGDFIRGFDVSGEWRELVRVFGGKIISLDGSDGVLNPLEVLKTSEEESQCLQQHLSKVQTIYSFLVPDCSERVKYRFENLLSDLYCRCGLLSSHGNIANDGKIAGLPPESYPIFEDLLNLINEYLDADYSKLNNVQRELKINELKELEEIKQVIQNLVRNYGKMFNGHTTMENILETQIVFFDIKGLAQMNEHIFDAQMFSALALCYDNCVKVGSVMKKGYEDYEKGDYENGISWENITRFQIYVDESHRIVNANKLTAVSQLVVYEREARKFFGGIMLASQSIRDYIPEGANADAVQQIKTLFELSQYKVIMKQDVNAVSTLVTVFGNELTKEELEGVPRFEAGQCILCISGNQNIQYHNYITDAEKQMFGGGA